jgi:hypothetical protein
VTVLWSNTEKLIPPDSILGSLDATAPEPLRSSATLAPEDYSKARAFIRRQFEAPPSEVHYEGVNYRMVRIDLAGATPRLHGALGLYYDNILTQYALEWELKKALAAPLPSIDGLGTRGTLPLREAIEADANPLLNGAGRCAAITVSTLVVFARPSGGFYSIIRRRSQAVGVSPGLHHVVPAGMFEAPNSQDEWSVEVNVWRELLEEVYNEHEQVGTGLSEIQDYLRKKTPIDVLLALQKAGAAELSITGFCCDLLNLRPELCTVLFVSDTSFAEARAMALNWEYEPEGPSGTFGVAWSRIDDFIARLGATGGLVVSGAVSLGLGREWVRVRHGI